MLVRIILLCFRCENVNYLMERCHVGIMDEIFKWAASGHNQQNDCAPSEDSDQPGHPPSLIRVFAVGCPGWSESSLCTQWVTEDSNFLHADREDSDQTGGMLRLIWVFAGLTRHVICFVMRRLKYLHTCLFYETLWKPADEHEPPHDKTNNMTCAPSEDSDQPGCGQRRLWPHWADT